MEPTPRTRTTRWIASLAAVFASLVATAVVAMSPSGHPGDAHVALAAASGTHVTALASTPPGKAHPPDPC